MSEKNLQKQTYRYVDSWGSNSDTRRIPYIRSDAGDSPTNGGKAHEFTVMDKDPHQSAELIRYLIKFIKSL